MIDARERSYFDRIVNILNEQETLKTDLAEMKVEMGAGNDALSPERIGDLIAVARKHVMDAVKRDAKDKQARRRAELEGQLSLSWAEAAE